MASISVLDLLLAGLCVVVGLRAAFVDDGLFTLLAGMFAFGAGAVVWLVAISATGEVSD